MKKIGNWGNSFHGMCTLWSLGFHFHRHRACTQIFWSNILSKNYHSWFSGGGNLWYSFSVWSSVQLFTDERGYELSPFSLWEQCSMVTKIWPFLTSPRMLIQSHQHMMTFYSSGKRPLVRLVPNLCNSLNKEVAIFPGCSMGSVWPLYLELWLLSLFQMKTVWLTAHNCWVPYKLRDIWPLKIMEGLLRMTDNLLLATLVPEQFDSTDFFCTPGNTFHPNFYLK